MNSSTLSLFSTGATTGFVTEIGHGTTTVVPVY
jgi:actin-related protein